MNDLKPILADVLQSLKPNAEWATHGDAITWIDKNQTQPTKSEIDTELTRMNNEWTANQFQRDRASKFPELKEQLDLLFHDMAAGKGTKDGEWYKAISKVKSDNPKP